MVTLNIAKELPERNAFEASIVTAECHFAIVQACKKRLAEYGINAARPLSEQVIPGEFAPGFIENYEFGQTMAGFDDLEESPPDVRTGLRIRAAALAMLKANQPVQSIKDRAWKLNNPRVLSREVVRMILRSAYKEFHGL